MGSLMSCLRGGLAAAVLLLAAGIGSAAPCPSCPPMPGPTLQPGGTPSAKHNASGWFVQIPPDCFVRNVGGNCGFCAIETISRYQGLAHMHGFSRGKGGCTSVSMARWLQKYGVEYEQATSRSESIALLQRYLSQGQPVLFSIPGHALVCCGWTRSADGREYMWIVDNTGREGCAIYGWPKHEWDRRFGGWVCALRPLFPRLRPPEPVAPQQHVPPAPGLVPQPMPSLPDKLAEVDKKLAALADFEKRIAALEKNLDAENAAAKETSSRLERLHEIAEKAATLAAGVSGKFTEELPKLHAAVNQAKDLGLVSSDKADKAHAALDKVGAVAGVLSDVREKVAASQAEARTTGVVGWLGGGAGLLGMILGLVATLRRPEGPKVLPIPERFQLPGNPILNAAANLPQIPGTIADDVARVLAQRIQAIFTQPANPVPTNPTPAAPAAA